MVSGSILTTTLLALAAAGSSAIVVKKPLVKTPIYKRLNFTGYNVVRRDQLRAKAMAIGFHSDISLQSDDEIDPQVDSQGYNYFASVGVGSPATTYSLIVDTGDSNTWIGNNQPYTVTSTSIKTPNSVSFDYGITRSGHTFFSGTEYIDQVTLGSGLVVPQQSFGVADVVHGFSSNIDGVLGIGPAVLTVGTLSPDNNTAIPTVADNLFSAGIITANEFSISFEPYSSEDQLNGEITWGGTDCLKYTGSITYAPITSTLPAGDYWGIDQSITYGANSTAILSYTAGAVDTGSTFILLASDAFSKYQAATGAVPDDSTQLLTLTPSQFDNLESLFFNINGIAFELTANAQIWPRNLNSAIGGIAGHVYLVVSNLGTPTGVGYDFVNGQAFLERFYSVYDAANKRVGLATTPFTTATSN